MGLWVVNTDTDVPSKSGYFLGKRIAKDMPIRRRRESIERTGFRIAEKGEIACARKAGDERSHKKEERRLRAPRISINCYCVCFFVI